MKASELRIGNWVCNQIHGVGFVEAISGLTVLYSRNYDSIPVEQFEPIPITEEWLLKFGFEHRPSIHNKKVYVDKQKIQLDIRCIGDRFYLGRETEFISSFKHVHQLQNLYFCITGEELTI
tara:strand:- start:9 stop:371 length:363 start_codon:yes stop_codon:yes gene_type:complete